MSNKPENQDDESFVNEIEASEDVMVVSSPPKITGKTRKIMNLSELVNEDTSD